MEEINLILAEKKKKKKNSVKIIKKEASASTSQSDVSDTRDKALVRSQGTGSTLADLRYKIDSFQISIMEWLLSLTLPQKASFAVILFILIALGGIRSNPRLRRKLRLYFSRIKKYIS